MAVVRKIMPSKVLIPKKKRVAAYARVSSGKDAMLHSLSAQVSYYSEYIQRHAEWEYMGVYADEARTGTKDDRPEFQRLLADCRSGKLDMVITKSISRFARNTVTLLSTVRELKEMGVSVFFEKEGLYSDRGEGEMVLTLLASVAQEESRAVSDNCKWRIRSRFKEGDLATLRFLYGYRIKKDKIEVKPEEAEVVHRIFQLYTSGNGCKAIVEYLLECSAPTPRGGQWTENRVRSVLKNEKYAGNALLQKKFILDHISKKVIYNYGQMPRYFAEGTHPAIISKEIFEKAQRLIEQNRIKNNIARKTPSKHPFTGKIVCGNCGKSFRRVVCRGKAKWQCATFLRKGRDACPAKQIPEDTLMSLTADVFGLETFDEHIFKQKIRELQIPASNTVRYIFCDGHEVEAMWQDYSRRESWTEEMRQKAREYSLRQGGR